MESAFGIEHGDFSKGLPSALRKPVSPSATGWEANAMIHRRNAHIAGTNAREHLSAAKNIGTGEYAGMNRNTAGSQGQYYGLRSKNKYKESLSNIKADSARRKKKRVLP